MVKLLRRSRSLAMLYSLRYFTHLLDSQHPIIYIQFVVRPWIKQYAGSGKSHRYALIFINAQLQLLTFAGILRIILKISWLRLDCLAQGI
jgi:hypothetical protein